MADLFLRLSAETGGAIRQLERVGFTLERLAGTAEESSRSMRASWDEDRSAAGRLASAIQADADRQIAAWKMWEEKFLEYAEREKVALAELVALHDEAINKLSQNPGLAKIHAARIQNLQEERAGILELSGIESAAAAAAIAASGERQKAIAANADKSIAKIKEQQAAQEEADRKRAEGLRKFNDQLSGSSMTMVLSGAAVTAGTALVADGIYKAATAASQFDSYLVMTVNHANLLTEELPAVKQGLLDMAGATGYGPQALAEAFYNVQSRLTSLYQDGLPHTTEKLHIMETAARLAAIGHADLGDTTKTLLSVMTAYGLKSEDASVAASKLNQIIGLGDVTMQQFAQAMKGGLLPVAAAAGISLESMGAAYGTLTDLGYGTAQSATYLRSAIIQMTMPSGPATKALDAIGLGAEEARKRTDAFSLILEKAGINQTVVAQKLRSSGSLSDTIQMLVDRMVAMGMKSGEATALVERAFGGIRSGAGVVGLTDNLQGLIDKEETIKSKSNDFEQVWDRLNRLDPAQAMRRFTASLKSLEVDLGEILIPIFLRSVAALASIVGRVDAWVDKNRSLVATMAPMILAGGALFGAILLLGGALGLLITGLGAVGGAFPIILGLLAGGAALMGGLTAAVIYARGHWGELHRFWQDHAVPILDSLHTTFDGVVAAIKPMWEVALPQLESNGRSLINWLTDTHGPLTDLESGLRAGLKAVQDWVHSPDFAGLMATFAVYLPKAAGVAINAFKVYVDTLRTAMSAASTVVKVGLDLQRHDFAAAGVDLALGWKGTNDLITQTAKDAQATEAANTDLWSASTAAKYVKLKDDILTATDLAMDPLPGKVQAAHGKVMQTLDGDMPHIRTKGFTYGTAMVGGISDASMDKDGRVPEALQKTIDAATDAAKMAMAASRAHRVGAELAQGVAKGINDNYDVVGDAVAGTVLAALERGRHTALSSSPSRLFNEKLGITIPQGVAQGVTEGTPLVTNAMTGLINTMANIPGQVAPGPLVGPRSINLPADPSVLMPNSPNGYANQTVAGPAAVYKVLTDILQAIKDGNAIEANAANATGTSAATAATGSAAPSDSHALIPALMYAIQDQAFTQRRRIPTGRFS